VVTYFQLVVSANLHSNVLCRVSTPTANMDPDPSNAATKTVLDVLVHKMGARTVKIRLDKLKESENNAK